MTYIGTLVVSSDPNEQPYWKETVKQFNFPTCHKHNLLLPNGFCDVCTAEELSKRLREREMNQEQKKEGDSRSFEDSFLKAHGMEPKKEERIEEMRLRQKSPMAPATWKVEARTKALELAIQEIDNMGCNNSVERERLIFNAAQRFYTYITKGE